MKIQDIATSVNTLASSYYYLSPNQHSALFLTEKILSTFIHLKSNLNFPKLNFLKPF